IMNTLSVLLPDPASIELENCLVDQTQAKITLIVSSKQTLVSCPVCNCLTSRIHSHYHRTLADLPWANYSITLQLLVRKFFCPNLACFRRIFTERIPTVAAPWARRTQRFTQKLIAIALASGGELGKRLCQQLGFNVSRHTLLRLISRLPLPSVTPQNTTLGVDDFAFRKRQNYGTIIVDLDHSRPIALLPDRDARTLAQWLQNHPGIQILSRDRSVVYKNAMTTGAPQAIQVADRFHLLQNLTEVLKLVFACYGQVLRSVDAQHRHISAELSPPQVLPAVSSSLNPKQQAEHYRKQRLTRYQKVWDLHRQGWSTSKIAHKVGLSSRTVQRYLTRPNFPERLPRSDRGKSLLNPYKDYILQRWNQGFYLVKQLFREIQQLGYLGGYMTLTRYTRQLAQAQGWKLRQRPRPLQLAPISDPQQPPLTAYRAAWLVLRPQDQQQPDDQQLLSLLTAAHPDLSSAIHLATSFAQIVRQRLADQFDSWLTQAAQSSLVPFQRFALSLQQDYDAILELALK